MSIDVLCCCTSARWYALVNISHLFTIIQPFLKPLKQFLSIARLFSLISRIEPKIFISRQNFHLLAIFLLKLILMKISFFSKGQFANYNIQLNKDSFRMVMFWYCLIFIQVLKIQFAKFFSLHLNNIQNLVFIIETTPESMNSKRSNFFMTCIDDLCLTQL